MLWEVFKLGGEFIIVIFVGRIGGGKWIDKLYLGRFGLNCFFNYIYKKLC